MKKTFDPKCGELADHFLQDKKDADAEDRQELASVIQQAVEDFFMVYEETRDVE